MNRLSRLLVLSAAVLAGCNLTYDREGLEFTPPASYESCTAAGLEFCVLGTREYCADLWSDPDNCGGCGNDCGVESCVGGSCGGAAIALAVEPLFPAKGSEWNAWVEGEGTSATDSSCNPSSGAPCTHGGELRQVVVTGKTSCDDLVASDALGAFDWVCDPTVNPVRFVSTGLKPGRRLADLLDPWTPAWLVNSVTVTDAMGLYGNSAPETWWSNQVEKVPSDGRLDVAGTVYVADGSVGPPYVLDADRVALAVPGSVSVGAVVTMGANVVSSTGRDFLWIEGDFDATGANHGALLDGVGYSVVREASVTRPADPAERYGLYLVNTFRSRMERVASSGSSAGVYLSGAAASDNRLLDLVLDTCPNACLLIHGGQRNAVSRVQARGGLGFGVQLNNASQNVLTQIDVAGFYSGVLVAYGSSENTLVDVATVANRQHGLDVTSAGTSNRFAGLVATHNGGNGVYLNTATRTGFVDVVVANNAGNGVAIDASQDCVVAGLTAFRNAGRGVFLLPGADHNLISTLLLVGIGTGLHLWNASNNTVGDLAFSDSPYGGLVSEGIVANQFTGEMRVGPAATCEDGGTAGAGFTDTCDPAGTSDYTLIDGLPSMVSSLVGAVGGDSVNLSPWDASGYLWIGDLDATWVDWTHFESPHRGWALQAGVGPLGCSSSSSIRTEGTCPGTWNGGAQLYDWSLRTADPVVRSVLPYPGSGSSRTLAWSDTTASTYLPRALERIGDAMGDDDGLCEPDEACLFTPNFGAYQGHDALEGPTWIDAAQIFTYAANGR